MAILFIVAYLFVKSFPQVQEWTNASPLVRITIVSLGPIVWNAAVLLMLFLVSMLLGPMLDTVAPKFGSVIAFVAHVLALVGVKGFFEFLVCILFSNYIHFILLLIPFPFPSGSLNSGTPRTPCLV